MADHTIRKVSHSGVGYSVVDLNDVRHVFAAATPLAGSTFDEQADDALRTIEAVIGEEGTRGSIVHQAVFLADMAHLGRCRQIMRDFYGPELPATSYIPQPPCGGKLLAIEALGVGQGRGEVEIQRVSEELVIARHNGIAWVHCTKTVPQAEDRPVYDGSLGVLEEVCRTFGSVNVRFDQVIRTWFYLGGIVEDDGPVQRYKELNRAGPTSSAIFISSTVAARRTASNAAGLSGEHGHRHGRPRHRAQRHRFGFRSQRHSGRAAGKSAADGGLRLRGLPTAPRAPSFPGRWSSRAAPIPRSSFPARRASPHSQTRHPGDAAKQTEETLDNIAALIAEENLARHGLPGLGTSLASLGFARVYIKRPEDYPAVRAVCEKRLGTLPTIYAIADVCRPELLVEIEGVAFSRLESQ